MAAGTSAITARTRNTRKKVFIVVCESVSVVTRRVLLMMGGIENDRFGQFRHPIKLKENPRTSPLQDSL